jgi:RHS repeat-associated protein
VSEYSFTGQFNQAISTTVDSTTNLIVFPGRSYLPSIGRFLQPDPLGLDVRGNLYAYAGNDALNRVDPLGLQGWVREVFPVSNSLTETLQVAFSAAVAKSQSTGLEASGAISALGDRTNPSGYIISPINTGTENEVNQVGQNQSMYTPGATVIANFHYHGQETGDPSVDFPSLEDFQNAQTANRTSFVIMPDGDIIALAPNPNLYGPANFTGYIWNQDTGKWDPYTGPFTQDNGNGGVNYVNADGSPYTGNLPWGTGPYWSGPNWGNSPTKK